MCVPCWAPCFLFVFAESGKSNLGNVYFFLMTTSPLLKTIKVLVVRKKEKWTLGMIQHLPVARK